MDSLIGTLVSTEGEFAMAVYADTKRFPCIHCRKIDHNGGTATIVTARTWWCWRCRITGTRYAIENEIVNDATLLDVAFSLRQRCAS